MHPHSSALIHHRQHGKKDAQASRLYPTVTASGTTKWVTRDIAALDFLLGIPMEQQKESVQTGWERQNKPTATGKWWERDVVLQRNNAVNILDGQRSATATATATATTDETDHQSNNNNKKNINNDAIFLEGPLSHATTVATRGGGRRLEGDTATKVEIPQTGLSKSTRQRYIARQAQVREWECQVVAQDILSARIFFSAKDNYPVSVFSVIKYEPKREEAARRRQKLEARGGGGTQFVVPPRDWRGTSYRALLPRRVHHHKKKGNYLRKGGGGFGRFLLPDAPNMDRNSDSDDDSNDSASSDEEDTYVPGFLDDPEMRQGRHRHVMIGDRVSGCIVSSTIQFVKPAKLKADLNKQFRERFDGWEPPQSQRKYIGAKIIDGVYKLMDPHETVGEEEVIRMPPSLTLSKIRSGKQQIALAAIHDAHLEVSTVALSFVYFERLCLDCRVDKSNRRLAFAACLLLAAKINEAKISLLVHREHRADTGLQSSIRPTIEASTMFASLLEFFTHDWALSLKHLFSAEWGVFAALGFRLHASPAQVQFHFRRIMKVLGWNALAYLGHEMYSQWQDCLEVAEQRDRERDERRERIRDRKERQLLQLELKRQIQEKEWKCHDDTKDLRNEKHHESPSNKPKQQMGAMKLIHRLTSSLARPPQLEAGCNVDHLSLASVNESNRRRRRSSNRTKDVESKTADGDHLSCSTHELSNRDLRPIVRSSSMPFLAVDGAPHSAPTSPMIGHLAIDIHNSFHDIGSNFHDDDDVRNTPSADATDCDEESIFY